MKPRDELDERLTSLRQGPWSEGPSKARSAVGYPGGLPRVDAELPLSLNDIHLTAQADRKAEELRAVLRPHWLTLDGITDQQEVAARDALDEALTLAQLYELAIETGYLPVDRVRRPARELLADLLWSAPARDFVVNYDYVAVAMLASRMEIAGLGGAGPPTPNPGAAMRFAAFLEHLRAFYSDDLIEVWIRFLDDYVVDDQEQVKLWRHLRGLEQDQPPRRIAKLLGGCQLFVASIADTLEVLDEDQAGRFGLVHGYWLQKFFGYRREVSGYVKDVKAWRENDSWAATMMASPVLTPTGMDGEVAELLRSQFKERIKVLEWAFEAVRKLASGWRGDGGRT